MCIYNEKREEGKCSRVRKPHIARFMDEAKRTSIKDYAGIEYMLHVKT